MQKSWFTVGALAVCVAALALFVWLKPSKPEGTPAASTLQAADVHSLRVLRKGKPLAVLEKRDREWYLIEPLKVPADSFQIGRLLAVLQAKAAAAYPASALEKFELNAPQAELIINDQRFAFGAINTVTREQYVLTQNQVLALELRFGAAIPSDAMALVRRSIFAPGDAPQRFDFAAFNVAYDGIKWRATPATGESANTAAEGSQDDFNRWVAQWREGSALRVERIDARKPQQEITVTLKDGAEVGLGVIAEPGELIVRRADLGLQFVFVEDIGKQMMAAPIVR